MYFDAGMGSLIIQAVIAILAVMGGYFAVMKTRLKSFFTKKKGEDTSSDTNNIDADKSAKPGETNSDDEL